MNEDWREEAGLRWRPLRPFGVEVDRDLSEPLPPVVAERFCALLRDHSLITAHGQSLDRAQQDAVTSHVGPVIAHREGDPGYIKSEGGDGPGTSRLSFHSDASYTDTPFEALSLHAQDVVDDASSTLFIDAQQALEALPEDLRAKLEAHDADMISAGFEKIGLRVCNIREHENPGYRNQLPSIRTNPRNGRRYLAVSEMMTAGLVGMEWEESRDTLNAVFDHIYAPENIHEHRWRNGDFVIWDNIALQHCRESLRDVGRRVLQRTIIGTKAVGIRQQARATAQAI